MFFFKGCPPQNVETMLWGMCIMSTQKIPNMSSPKMSTPAPPLGKNATQLATLQSRPPVNRRLDETAWSTTLSVANGKNRPGTMGLGIWVETLWSDSHRGTNGLAALTAAMCRPFYRVWGRSRSISAHDETTRAPSSWHLRSSDALWRARTFAQAHCNSQKLAAGQKNNIYDSWPIHPHVVRA